MQYIITDGLFILLKPQKKKKSYQAADQPMVPSSLMHMVMQDILPATCPWSLSGPQFPHPTAIQQRYCYPKGDPDYSSQKGGALWTMYGTDGKEDLEYRLLHVYFSAKRAINKGHSKESPVSARRGMKKTSARRSKHTRAFSHGMVMNTVPPTLFPPHVEMSPDIFNRNFHPIPGMEPSMRLNRQLMMPFSDDPLLDPFGMDLDEVTASPDRQPQLPNEEQFLDPFGIDFDQAFSELDQFCSNPFAEDDCNVQVFQTKLHEMHSCLKDSILFSAPEAEQGQLVTLLSNWAKQVAASPLGTLQSFEGV